MTGVVMEAEWPCQGAEVTSYQQPVNVDGIRGAKGVDELTVESVAPEEYVTLGI